MRRLMRRTAVVAAAASCVAWIAHVPYRPETLARAVPYGARWVSRHRAPAARWETLRGSRLVRLAGRLFGTADKDWNAILEDPETQTWVRRFGSREVWFFDVPGAAAGAVGGAAWLGGGAWRWRIALHAGWVGGWRRYADHRGRTIWVWPHRLGAEGPFAAIALEEGLLLACISHRPADLLRLLETYDGTAPRSGDPLRLLRRRDPDSILLQLGRGPGPDLVEIGIAEASGPVVRGRATIEGWELTPPAESAGGPPTPISPLVATILSRAAAALIVPPESADPWWPSAPPAWVAEVRGLLRSDTRAPWILAVHDEPLAGRWFGIRVPGVTVSLPVSDLDGFEQRLDALLDRWNAEGRWGLIRGPLPGASQVRAIEHTGDGTLRRWLSGRGPGYVWADGWLTIAASTDTLQMLLAVAAATPTNSTGDTAVNGRPRALARGPPLASALRMTAAAYILYRTVTDPEGSRGERSAVLAALPSFDIVREFEELDAVLGGEDGQWQADFTARLQPGTHPPLDAAGEAGVP